MSENPYAAPESDEPSGTPETRHTISVWRRATAVALLSIAMIFVAVVAALKGGTSSIIFRIFVIAAVTAAYFDTRGKR